MAPTNIELYEALKRDLNEEAARRIAEVVPAAADLATKRDLESVKSALSSDIAEFRTHFAREIGRLETRMEALHASTLRWMIGLFLPAWAVTAGTLFTVVLKS